MHDVKVPSLQHLARNYHPLAQRIASRLVRLVLSPPNFNYNALVSAVIDLLVLHVPYDDVVEGIKRIKRPGLRANLLSVLPLIRNHFEGVRPDYFQGVDRRYYSVGRGLMVPFEPPMIYGVGGQLYLPWFSFWRRNPLAKERLSLFVTLVEEILLDDPDLETARFEILDFSATKGKRSLKVIDAADVPRVDNETKTTMLATFADGFSMAQAQLNGMPAQETPVEEERPRPDPNQPRFPGFDDPP